jgi:hypothetical protein
MHLIYCCDPINPLQPDPLYQDEVEAAKQVGLNISLISYEALVHENNASKAVARVPEVQDTGIYRGWMLKPEQYRRLYEALLSRGIHLTNDPTAYKHCHYLPESYSIIEACTPKSVWLPITLPVDFERVMDVLRPFGPTPVIVKDYVKSQKHYWYEACYIPSAADREAVERVVSRFIQLQDDDLNEGLVFRQFVDFEPLGTNATMPISREFRIFFLDSIPLYSTAYWPDFSYTGEMPPMDMFTEIAHRIKSRFFTMDVAKDIDGQWMTMELGDGQVAGLPETADPVSFYKALKNALANE